MKSLITIVLSIALSLTAALLVFKSDPNNRQNTPETESVYDRVMATKTLRCGYALWPPYILTKDANTGALGGIFYDVAEATAASLHLKIEWAEETGWGSYIEGLNSNRFDLFCSAVWRNAEKGALLNYNVPLAYSAMHFYARSNDTRFDNGLVKLNDPEYKLSVMDGEISQMTANRFFPKAKQVSIPQMADITQIFLNVATGKADGVFSEPGLAQDFANKNPGTIRQVTKEPFQVFPNSFAAKIGEDKLTHMIDSALIELQNAGEVDRIIVKHAPDRSIFMPVAKPYTYAQPQPLR